MPGLAADFAADLRRACEAINRWAAEAIRGRIGRVVEPEALDAITRLLLASAV